MAKLGTLVVWTGMAILCANRAGAQFKADVVRLGKAATAYVEVTHGENGASGTAFCVDRSGLFVTNSHVVSDEAGREGTVRLVVDIGEKTQRILPAKVLRRDDEMDLALLRAERASGLTALKLGRDEDLSLLGSVATFGFPFGNATAVGRSEFPDITVLASRITAFQRDGGRLAAVQFDNQINPGNSGGPVLDGSGAVVGVARATVVGAGLNLAIPVGRLAEFLKAPGLAFDPPVFSHLDRADPVSWTIRVRPSEGESAPPDSLSVAVTLSNGAGDPRTILAESSGPGLYKARVVPVARDPDWEFGGLVTTADGLVQFTTRVSDPDVRSGDIRCMIGLLRGLLGGRSPRTASLDAAPGPDLKLANFTVTTAQKTTTIDLNREKRIALSRSQAPRVQTVLARVEARQGTKILATVRRRIRLEVPAGVKVDKEPLHVEIQQRPTASPPPNGTPLDEGRLTLGGAIGDGIPRGSGRSIRPPGVNIPAARLRAEATGTPLERRLGGKISDLAVGGGGRYLILTIGERRQVAIFDVNKADIVKTIDLPAWNAIVVGGARKVLIVFPDEKLMQRWDLETLTRDGPSRASPIDGTVTSLAMGSDSDGPALALWKAGPRDREQFSFIDPDSLTVSAIGLIAGAGHPIRLSASGGSFEITQIQYSFPWNVRASAGGDVFQCGTRPVLPLGRALVVGEGLHYKYGNPILGPDGRTIFSAFSRRFDLDNNPFGPAEPKRFEPHVVLLPCHDPSFYLSLGGVNDPNPPMVCNIHSADGSTLLTVHGLDEMARDTKKNAIDVKRAGDLTIDKRVHFVPAAHLLITVPAENDRLLLRRVDLRESLDRAGGNYLVVVSSPCLGAVAGQTLEHRFESWSKVGGVAYEVVGGPEGLKVSANGKLTWPVPMDRQGEDVTVVVSVKDATLQARSQSLLIRVK